MSLLTAPSAPTAMFELEITLSFKNDVLNQTRKSFNTRFGPQCKDRKRAYQVLQIFGLFCNLVALILA